MRFFHTRRKLARSEVARLVQIDYAREMAFVATTTDDAGEEKTLGVVRAVADPDNVGADFAIILRPECKGTGLGRVLMDKLIRYQRAAGTRQLIGHALSENQRIRALVHDLGFVEQPVPGDRGTVRMALDLQTEKAGRAAPEHADAPHVG